MPQGLVRYFSIFAAVIYAAFLSIQVPLERDEGISLRQIGCAQNLHSTSFIDNCNGAFNLSILGHELPLRSYYYLGFSQNFFFAPFYYFWPSYYMGRAFGILLLLALGWLIALWSGIENWIAIVMVLSCFPLLLYFPMDTGMALQGFFLLFLPFSLARVEKNWQAIGWGLLAFVALEIKMFFLAFVPALFVLYIWEKQRLGRSPNRMQLLWALAVPFILITVLLLSHNRSGEYYFQELLATRGGSLNGDIISAFSQKTINYLLSLPYFGNRIYNLTPQWDLATILFWGICAISFFLARKERSVWWSGIAVVSAVACVQFVALADSGHHYMMFFPLLLLSVAFALQTIPKKLAVVLVIAMVSVQAWIGVWTISQNTTSVNDLSRMPVYRELLRTASEDANKYLFIIGDPGIFFSLLLYLPKEQAITWPKLQTEENFAYIKNKLQEFQRIPIFIFRDDGVVNQDLLRKNFPQLRKQIAPEIPRSSLWGIWR